MRDADDFLEKIRDLKETAVYRGGYLEEADIEEAFPKADKKLLETIHAYFKENHIGIGEPLEEGEYLSEKESGHLKFYMEELEELEEVDDSMKRVLTMNAMNGDNSARERLTKAYLPNIVDIARLYTGQGVEIGDLIGEGNVALAFAMDGIGSLEKPEECDEMVARAAMNAMEELIGRENEETEALQKLLDKIRRVGDKAKAMSGELGRKVSVAELADTGLTEEEIREAARLSDGLLEYIAL